MFDKVLVVTRLILKMAQCHQSM